MARALAHHDFTRGRKTPQPHSAHPQCRLGMAAYWLEMVFMADELNDQKVGYFTSVST